MFFLLFFGYEKSLKKFCVLMRRMAMKSNNTKHENAFSLVRRFQILISAFSFTLLIQKMCLEMTSFCMERFFSLNLCLPPQHTHRILILIMHAKKKDEKILIEFSARRVEVERERKKSFPSTSCAARKDQKMRKSFCSRTNFNLTSPFFLVPDLMEKETRTPDENR